MLCTLQRHWTENWNKIFPERKLCGHSPNYYIQISMSDFYIPTKTVCLFGCRKKGGPILGIYKSQTDI